MSFTRGSVRLPPGTPVLDGVIAAADVGLLADAERTAAGIMADARQRAEAVLAQAQDEARALTHEAAETARTGAERLLAEMQREWDAARLGIEAAAVAIAGIAFERLCAGSSWQERIDAAVALALRELPQAPVRLWTAPGAPRPECASEAACPVAETESLPAGAAAAAEDGVVTVVASFELAQARVSDDLRQWLRQASRLVEAPAEREN